MVAIRGQTSVWPSFPLLARFLTPRVAATQTREKVRWRFVLNQQRTNQWKKHVPYPPRAHSFQTFCSINLETPSVDALTHTRQLIAGIETTLEEYICANANEPGVRMLVNTVHHLQMIQALTEMLQRAARTP